MTSDETADIKKLYLYQYINYNKDNYFLFLFFVFFCISLYSHLIHSVHYFLGLRPEILYT